MAEGAHLRDLPRRPLRKSDAPAQRTDQGGFRGGVGGVIRWTKSGRVVRIEKGDVVKCRTCGKTRAAFATGQRCCKPCRREAVRGYQARYRESQSYVALRLGLF